MQKYCNTIIDKEAKGLLQGDCERKGIFFFRLKGLWVKGFSELKKLSSKKIWKERLHAYLCTPQLKKRADL